MPELAAEAFEEWTDLIEVAFVRDREVESSLRALRKQCDSEAPQRPAVSRRS